MDKQKATIQARQEQEKTLVIESLRKTPIVQAVCEKLNIGRATYYRWRKEDKEFAKLTDEALKDGSMLVNDLAENQLISAIKDKNMTAVIYWLRHHHPNYKQKLEVTTNIKQEELTPEQETIVREALRLASVFPSEKHQTLGEPSLETNSTNNEQ